MKKYVLIIASFLILSNLLAQSTKEYFDKNDRPCDETQAYYYREGMKIGKNKYSGEVKDYFVKTGLIKSESSYDSFGFQSGPSSTFYSNNSPATKSIYHLNYRIGPFMKWYPNGQLMFLHRFDFIHGRATSQEKPETDFRVVTFFDSLGNELAKKGQGEYYEYHLDFSIKAKGKIKKGLKVGDWQGFFEDGTKIYEESYEKGELVEGRSFGADGNEIAYTELKVDASPFQGTENYNSYIKSYLNISSEGNEKCIGNFARVAFTVNEDGTLSDFNVIKKAKPSCDKEAIRILKEGPKWNAQMLRGIPVKSKTDYVVWFRK